MTGGVHPQFRLRDMIGNVVSDVKYRAIVPNGEHKQASGMVEAFAGEALSYLNDNLTVKLKPLHPSRSQVSLFQELMESVRNGSLVC